LRFIDKVDTIGNGKDGDINEALIDGIVQYGYFTF
jgi:hypothetical protein